MSCSWFYPALSLLLLLFTQSNVHGETTTGTTTTSPHTTTSHTTTTSRATTTSHTTTTSRTTRVTTEEELTTDAAVHTTESPAKSCSTTCIVLAVVIPLIILALIGVGIFLFIRYRRIPEEKESTPPPLPRVEDLNKTPSMLRKSDGSPSPASSPATNGRNGAAKKAYEEIEVSVIAEPHPSPTNSLYANATQELPASNHKPKPQQAQYSETKSKKPQQLEEQHQPQQHRPTRGAQVLTMMPPKQPMYINEQDLQVPKSATMPQKANAYQSEPANLNSSKSQATSRPQPAANGTSNAKGHDYVNVAKILNDSTPTAKELDHDYVNVQKTLNGGTREDRDSDNSQYTSMTGLHGHHR